MSLKGLFTPFNSVVKADVEALIAKIENSVQTPLMTMNAARPSEIFKLKIEQVAQAVDEIRRLDSLDDTPASSATQRLF